MLIYVAGKWEEKEAVRWVIAELRNADHEITFDWTEARNIGNNTMYREAKLRTHAIHDYHGVMDADVLVAVLTNEKAYLGKSQNRYAEISMALGAHKRVFIIGAPREDFLFWRLPEVRCMKTVRGIIDALRG